MPTIDIVFIIIIFVLVLSVVLSIVDWIYLTSLSSKCLFLEGEIEKKTTEFDSLKREKYSSDISPSGSISVIESNEPLTTDSVQQTNSAEDTIQIVRNIRGNFEQSEHFTHSIENFETPSQPHPSTLQNHTLSVSQALPTLETKQVFPYHSEKSENNQDDESTAPQSQPDTFGEPKNDRLYDDTLNCSQTPSPIQTSPPNTETDILCPLYSPTLRDADFQFLWKQITEVLKVRQKPLITIDFTNINFIYDKEMDYLEKINYLIADQGGILHFINCDNELLTLFQKKPLLYSLTK